MTNIYSEIKEQEPLTPEIALETLLQGNERFIRSRMLHPNQDEESRIAGAKEQNPFAAVITCSDSRVSPEIIFDQGLGDLFVARIGANLVNEDIISSIEFAVNYFGVRLIVVLGHEDCGAIKSAVNSVKSTKNINNLLRKLDPLVEQAKKQSGDTLLNAVKINVNCGCKKILSSSEVIADYVKQNKLLIKGAYYSITSGRVELID